MGTVPTPLDWIGNAGNFASAAMLEAGVGDVLSFLLDPPAAQARRTTAQAIANNTATTILFDSEDFDNDTMHSTSVNTGRLTCFTPGKYLVTGAIPYDPAATGVREARLMKNAGTFVPGGRSILEGPSRTLIVPPLEVALVATDYLELVANQVSGGSLNTTAANGMFPFLRARWIAP